MAVRRGRVLRDLALLFLGIIAAAPPVAALADPLIPVEKYAELPVAQSARLSPDGTKIAIIASVAGRQMLAIHALHGGAKMTGVDLGQYQARWFGWKRDDRLVAGVFTSTDDLFLSGPSRQSEVTRMVAFDADGKNLLSIGAPRNGYPLDTDKGESRTINPQFQDEIVSMLDHDPHHVLQLVLDQFPERGSGVTPSVFEVDIDTGLRRKIVRPRAHILRYMADPSGVVRLGFGVEGTIALIIARDNEEADWRTIYEGAADTAGRFVPLGFIPDQPDRIYVQTSGGAQGATGLWSFNLKTASFDHPIDPGIAANGITDRRDGRLVGYMSTDGAMKYLDPAWQRDLDAIRKALKGMRAEIIDRSSDGIHVFVETNEPHHPVAWWLLDRSNKPATLSPVIETYPEIAEAGIAPVTMVHYAARDGLSIPGWLTLPVKHADGPIPFVVLPHGGPSACDSDGFDYEAQFLASRGWGVLQPQFRGSTCFGDEFERRGFREWGYAMQDDVTDGTRWLIEQHLADPARICIVGSSYGGYAALEGVVKEPSLYRCAAAWAPVTDLPALRSDEKQHLYNTVALDRLGDDGDRLRAASPARHADQIRVPVLLMHGKTDFTVQASHSRRMETALKDEGKPVEAIYLDDADHFRLQYPARLAWLKALERFLGANLGLPAPQQ